MTSSQDRTLKVTTPSETEIVMTRWFDAPRERVFDASTKLEHIVLWLGRRGDTVPVLVTFELAGQQFRALNGGPAHRFNEAVSLFVSCESQAEIDRYWQAPTADGGEESMCGWLKDKYGLSWQIVPSVLGDLIGDPDPERSQRAVQAMLQMRKLDIQLLQGAHSGASA